LLSSNIALTHRGEFDQRLGLCANDHGPERMSMDVYLPLA
jgi:hypothetical protein